MKKIIIACGMLLLGGVLRAAVPLDQNPQNPQEANWNTTLLGNSTGFLTLPALSKVSGSTTYSGRNCITNLILQMTTAATFYLLDGNTTSYVIYGAGLGATGPATLSVNRDRLGPICGTAGNTMSINMQPASTGVDVANYEGYTWFSAGNAAQ